jgi:hypothetical protein
MAASASRAAAPSYQAVLKEESAKLDMTRVEAAMTEASGTTETDLRSLDFGDVGSERREALTAYFSAYCETGKKMKLYAAGGACDEVCVCLNAALFLFFLRCVTTTNHYLPPLQAINAIMALIKEKIAARRVLPAKFAKFGYVFKYVSEWSVEDITMATRTLTERRSDILEGAASAPTPGTAYGWFGVTDADEQKSKSVKAAIKHFKETMGKSKAVGSASVSAAASAGGSVLGHDDDVEEDAGASAAAGPIKRMRPVGSD